MLDQKTAARYPFLKESADLLRQKGVTLESLISSLAYERARTLGKERVLEAIEFAKVVERPIATETDAMNELLSYPVARMLVSCLGDEKFVRRYAIAEAKLANARLSSEVERAKETRLKRGGTPSSGGGGADFVMRVAEELGLSVHTVGDSLAVDFSDYLRFSSAIKSKSWKLVNQDVRNGETLVDVKRLVRLVEQMITEKIVSELPLPVTDLIIEALADDV